MAKSSAGSPPDSTQAEQAVTAVENQIEAEMIAAVLPDTNTIAEALGE